MDEHTITYIIISTLFQIILYYGILSRKKENNELKKSMANFKEEYRKDLQCVQTNNFNYLNEIRKEIVRLKNPKLLGIGEFVEVSNIKYHNDGIYRIKDITTSTNMEHIYYVLDIGTIPYNQVTPVKLCKKSKKC